MPQYLAFRKKVMPSRRLLCASNDDCAFHYLYKSSHCQTCCWVFQSGGPKGLKWPEKIKQSLTHNFLVGVMKHMNKSCKNDVKWPSFQDSFWKSMHVMWRTWIQHKAVHETKSTTCCTSPSTWQERRNKLIYSYPSWPCKSTLHMCIYIHDYYY